MFEEHYNKQPKISPKSKKLAFLLCIVLGFWGAPYFYVGKKASGFIRLFTWNFLYIGFFIDLYTIHRGEFQDKDGLPVIE